MHPWIELLDRKIAAWYMLWLYQRIFFNPVNSKWDTIKELDVREIVILRPMVVLIFWIGLFPNSMLSFMHASVSDLFEQVTGNPEGIASGVQLAVDHGFETASKAVYHVQRLN